MRFHHCLVVGILAGVILSGCGATSTPTTQNATATPAPPQVITRALASPTSQPTPTFPPTSEPTAAPSPTPKSELTSTEPAPTPTPTEEIPAPTATTAPTPTPASSDAQNGSTNPTPTTSAGAVCEDKAAFYADVTIPDNSVFQQSVEFIKTWQIKNAGSCTWDGYSLVFGGGNSLNAPLSVPIPVVQPGELAEISVKLKSPNQGGVYTSLWEFQSKDGKRFGVNAGGVDFIWAKIAVSTIPEGSDQPGAKPLPGPASCQTTQDDAIVSQLLALINQARTKAGLNPLVLQPQLSAAAQGHSQDMACKNYQDHIGSDGSSWYNRIKAQGYAYRYASENIWWGDPASGGGANDAFTWWMGSKVHHDNILSPKVTEIGIGYAYYADSTYKGYYTLNFGKR